MDPTAYKRNTAIAITDDLSTNENTITESNESLELRSSKLVRKAKTAEVQQNHHYPKNIKLEPILIKDGINIATQKSKNFLQRKAQAKMLDRVFSGKEI